jgi:hypothetical protein
LTFAEEQLSLIHLKNGTLGSKGHCVAVEQNIAKLFLVLPMHPYDIDILRKRWAGRFSDQKVYELVLKIRIKRLLAALY